MVTSASFWAFSFNYFILLSSATFSGLYLDNGHDQTVIHRSLSHREKQHFELELLDLLGLQERPRVSRATPVRSAAHKYLLDLYKSQLETPARSTRSQFDINEMDSSILEESDAILSLKNLYRSKPNESIAEDVQKLWFDVKTIPPSIDGIIRAELRVFQSSITSLPSDKPYSIAVQQIKKGENGDEILELVKIINTTVGFEGWHSFNMTGPLSDWLSSGNNFGLYLRAFESGMPDTLVNLSDLGVAGGTPHPRLDGEDEPFMVVFMHGEAKRAPRVRRQTRHRKKKTENSETPNMNPLTEPSAGHGWSQSPRSCQIQSLFVNFKDLEWQDWIIAPVGYSAYYCSGECNFPLNAHMNATNHAIVQTLVNLINPLKVPRPCCAPTKLTPISVLYFVDESNVILKKYKNMVVKSCGCH
uniref:Protein 60A n=1 Tax=Lygus hesperus TaxID=30085 RepID=A0A0A9VRZ3_LYGHE